jgi:murein L,D-transpeptidase YcbB/YkuD
LNAKFTAATDTVFRKAPMSVRKIALGLACLGLFAASQALAGRNDQPFQNSEARRNTGASPFDFLFTGKKRRQIEILRDGRRIKKNIYGSEPQSSPRRRTKAPVPDTGNLVYRPEELKPLFAAAFEEPEPTDPLARAIRLELLDKSTTFRVTAEERKAILGFYAGNRFKPLWTDGSGLAPRAKLITDLFAAAHEEGFEPEDYLLPEGQAGNFEALAHLDLAMTVKVLLYARQASGGRLLPNRLTSYHDIVPERADPSGVLRIIAWSPFPDAHLRSLQPRHPAYGLLKAELGAVKKVLANEDPPIAEGRRVKRGARDPRVVTVRKRLEVLGFGASLPPHVFSADGLAGRTSQTARPVDYLDEDLADALRRFQQRNDLKITGAIDNQTIRMLNGRSAKRDETRLILNLERLRWLPDDLGPRHIFVNQAAFEMTVNDGVREVWRTNVIVGRPETQTSVFNDEMETVVFNPAWGVPPSIISNEMLPILRRDPGYLDRLGYTVVNKRGRRVKSSSIRWSSYGERPPFSVMQPPGEDNALGEVKFLFPNSHNIYMHDTPSRRLFSRPQRAFSHGCVRVENPRRLAEIVLDWNGGEVEKAITSRRSRSVGLKTHIPVYLSYFTAWPNATGKIQHLRDIYGRDRVMEQALMNPRLALR